MEKLSVSALLVEEEEFHYQKLIDYSKRAKNIPPKHTIEECQKIAELKGGKCLSTIYINNRQNIEWQCKYGHKWKSNLTHIIYQSHWCPKCREERMHLTKHTIQELQNLAISRNGVCLSTEYINNHQKMKWKCNKCQHEWQAIAQNILAGQWCPNCNKPKKKPIKYCKKCGKECPKCQSKPSCTSTKIYCSKSCRDEYEYNDFIKKWKNGEVNASKGNSVSSIVRKYLINLYGEKCSKCGWSELNIYTNSIPLHIHHINGNSKDNVPSNLDLLCPNCHSLTENFGSHKRRLIK